MLKAIGFLIKVSMFAITVLVIGATVRWEGRTISDHVRTTVAGVQKTVQKTGTVDKVKDWAGKVTEDARKGINKIETGNVSSSAAPTSDTLVSSAAAPSAASVSEARKPATRPAHAEASDDIPSSERQKLRALIRELNSAHP